MTARQRRTELPVPRFAVDEPIFPLQSVSEIMRTFAGTASCRLSAPVGAPVRSDCPFLNQPISSGALRPRLSHRMRSIVAPANDPAEMSLWVNFCRAILRNARLPYPTKLPRRQFAIEAVTGQERIRRVLRRHCAGGAAAAAQPITGQGLPLDNSTAASASRC